MGGGKWHRPVLSPPDLGICTYHFLGSLHRRVNNLPSHVPGFHQIPAFILSVSELSACQMAQYSCVLSRACGWVSKLQILGTYKVQTYADPLGESLAMLWQVLVCPRKAVA